LIPRARGTPMAIRQVAKITSQNRLMTSGQRSKNTKT
jgi:hypothetical protein